MFDNLCVYLSGFVAMIDACITTNVLFSKLSISINIDIISFNDFITGQPRIEPRSQTVAVMPCDNITLTCVVVQAQYLALVYTWYQGNGNTTKSIGVHSSKFTISRFGLADEGQYYCEAKAYGHCGKSNRITLTLDGEIILLLS